MKPIGLFHSCFKEKFGIPRQPGLSRHARGFVAMLPEFAQPDAFRGIDGFSHLWLCWEFHQAKRDTWSPTVRPPRLGGNQRVGVFATRSPFRPNPLGMSVVAFDHLVHQGKRVELHVRGGDLVDGTPILDIKPYLPYADAVPQASGGFAAAKPPALLPVRFTEGIARSLAEDPTYPQDFKALIVDVLAADPRPAYRRKQSDGEYGVKLYGYDVKWRMHNGEIEVFEIVND